VEASLKSARDSLASAKDQIKLIRTELDVFPELIELKSKLAQLTGRAELFEARFRKASGQVTMAISTHFAEYEAVRMDIASILRATAESAGKKVAELFDLVCKDGSRASKADISAYLSANSCVVEAEKLDKLLERAVDDDGPADTIGRADFDRMVRVYYKVVKDIVLSDSLLIESAKQLRRMAIGESVEVLEGPVMEDILKVYRVRVLSLKDGLEGWVTIAGNQGVTFLKPGGNVFKVVKPVPLSAELKDADDKDSDGQNVLRELREGEVLEVLEWDHASKKGAMGPTRIKAKVQSDGMKGWVSISDPTGSVYLEAA